MKLKKGQLSDIIWILVVILLLFTPLGFHAKVSLMRLFSFSPTIEKQETYEKLNDYSLRIIDRSGNQQQLSKKRDKVLVINYWATWCPPCIAEMPSLVALHEDYGDKANFVFLTNDDKTKVENYIVKNNYDIPVFFYTSKQPQVISAPSIPTTYIIDTSGNIILKEVGAANWNAPKVRTLLDSLSTSL